MVGAYFTICNADPQRLPHFLVSGVLFAIANQLGNAGQTVIAIIILLTGAAYAAYKAVR